MNSKQTNQTNQTNLILSSKGSNPNKQNKLSLFGFLYYITNFRLTFNSKKITLTSNVWNPSKNTNGSTRKLESVSLPYKAKQSKTRRKAGNTETLFLAKLFRSTWRNAMGIYATHARNMRKRRVRLLRQTKVSPMENASGQVMSKLQRRVGIDNHHNLQGVVPLQDLYLFRY